MTTLHLNKYFDTDVIHCPEFLLTCEAADCYSMVQEQVLQQQWVLDEGMVGWEQKVTVKPTCCLYRKQPISDTNRSTVEVFMIFERFHILRWRGENISCVCGWADWLTVWLISLIKHSPYCIATSSSAIQEIPRIYGIQMFITTFTITCRFVLSTVAWIQSVLSHPVLLRPSFSIILPFIPRSPNWSHSFWFLHLYAFLFSSVHSTCPAHLILFDLTTLIVFGEKYNMKVCIM